MALNLSGHIPKYKSGTYIVYLSPGTLKSKFISSPKITSPCAKTEFIISLEFSSISLDNLTFIGWIVSEWHGFVPSAHSDIQAS